MKVVRALFIACMVGGQFAAATTVPAQEYPSRPIRVIVATGPGGVADVFIRVLGDELQRRWKQSLVVENRPGGNFNLASRACADAEPDGYTICLLPNEVVTYNALLYIKLPYDPDRSIEPVTRLFYMSQILAANASLNVHSLADLATLSKAKPGTLSYATPALAETVFMQSFSKETGADLVRVPFRGSNEAVTGMLSGATPVVFIAVGNLTPHLRSGAATGILINTKERSPLFPDIPTLWETGYKGDFTLNYFAVFAPAGTPRTLIEKIQQTMRDIAQEPGFRDKNLVQRGLVPIFDTPEQFRASIGPDRVAAKRIFDASGMQPQ